MKTVIFIVAGLLLGTLGGTGIGGIKGKAAILAELQTQKAAAESAQHEEPAEDSTQPQPQDEAEGSAEHSQGTGADFEVLDPTESSSSADTQTSMEKDADGAAAHQADLPGEGGPNPVQPKPSPGGTNEGTPEEASAEPEGGTARLARIFGAMKAKDASNVLQNLNDTEVRAILFHLTDRKAAEILGNFEPARAATLSRAVLGSPGGEGS